MATMHHRLHNEAIAHLWPSASSHLAIASSDPMALETLQHHGRNTPCAWLCSQSVPWFGVLPGNRFRVTWTVKSPTDIGFRGLLNFDSRKRADVVFVAVVCLLDVLSLLGGFRIRFWVLWVFLLWCVCVLILKMRIVLKMLSVFRNVFIVASLFSKKYFFIIEFSECLSLDRIIENSYIRSLSSIFS